jgi:hypothetical protein
MEFPAIAADDVEAVTYRIDERDDIVFVSESWGRFAVANGAAGLATGVLGRLLWDFVGEMTTRQLYENLVDRGRTAAFTYRCDAPECRRFMHMTLRPSGRRGVEFDSVTLRTEARRPIVLAPAPAGPADRLLCMCSWCKRVDVHGAWEEIETAVQRLAVFDAGAPPAVTHAMCADCQARILAEIAGP